MRGESPTKNLLASPRAARQRRLAPPSRLLVRRRYPLFFFARAPLDPKPQITQRRPLPASRDRDRETSS
jgi:hypothetical protein